MAAMAPLMLRSNGPITFCSVLFTVARIPLTALSPLEMMPIKPVRKPSCAFAGRLLDHLWELEVRSLHPRELSAFSQAQPVSLLQLQSSLAEGELVIEYVLEPSRSFTPAITLDRIAHYELKSRNEIESAVELHLAAIRNRRDGRAEAKALYQLFLQPGALLCYSTRVVIVPYCKLHIVAFYSVLEPDDMYVVHID